jgi:hypothetical protein
MAFDPFLAIRFTPHSARLAGWADHLGQVFGVFGFHTRNPTALEFVTAVRDWQLAHPPLDADGLLGPLAWDQLRPTVLAYTGAVPAGTRPDWVGPTQGTMATGDGATTPTEVATPHTPCAEDLVLQALIREWLRVGGTLEGDPGVAVPISAESALERARESSPTLASGGICGLLRTGQVWPGVAGNRIIVALIGGSPPAAGAVVFVTDSGQAYYQTAEAWSADYLAGVYAGVVRTVAPLQTLHALEADVLLGVCSAGTGGGPPSPR